MNGEQKQLSGKEVVETETIAAIADTNIIAIADTAEQRLAALHKIKQVALKLTNPNDWVDEGGKPYLQASGAEKVARLFGVSWRIGECLQEDLGSGHYSFTFSGEFSLGGATITAIGTRASRDSFFTTRYVGRGEERRKIELSASEVDRGDVKKAAYTNLLANGITRLLGIRNLTWDDLKEFAGISQGAVQGITYKSKGKPQEQVSQPSSQKQEAPTVKEPGARATEAQCAAIHGVLKDKLGITDELVKHEKVSKIIGSPTVITSMSKLTKAQASAVIQALQAEAKAGQSDVVVEEEAPEEAQE